MDLSVTRFFKRSAVASVPVFASALAHAAPDYSGITSSIDWSTALTAVGTVFGGVAGVYMLIKGGKLILGVLKRG